MLSNGDFAILGKNITEDTVDEAVKKIRLGLSSDPSFTVEAQKILRSCIIFPKTILRSMSRFKICTKMTIMRIPENPDEGKRPIRADEIDDVIAQLDTIDIPEIIKRQSALPDCRAGKIPGCVSGIFCGGQGFERAFGQEP